MSAGPEQAPTRRGEEGFVAGFAGLLFGLLLFVVGTLLVAYAWAVVDTKGATTEAARQAARTYVGSTDPSSAAVQAEQAAAQALIGYGRDPSRASVHISGAGLGRCSRIAVTVSYPAPLFDVPLFGPMGRGEAVASSNSELVDPYVSGLPGVAACP